LIATIDTLVLNLTPDKSVAYGEVFRVIKPGGRFLYADIVVGSELCRAGSHVPDGGAARRRNQALRYGNRNART